MADHVFNGSCECKANQFSFGAEPIARFNCHCLVCQKYSGKAYSDVTVFLRKDVKDFNIEATKFKRFKLPPNIKRGICTQCHKPSLELGILGQLVFVPTKNIENQAQLPEPSMHLFYHRRTADIEDNLPKYYGFMHSELSASALLIKGTLKQIIH